MKFTTSIIAFTLILFSVFSSKAQNILGTIKNNAKTHIENKADKESNNALDKIENKADNVGKKKDKNQNSEGTEGSNSTEVSNSNTQENQEKKPDDKPSFQSYSKYDFKPGEQIIFYDDFSQDAVGDFPLLWNTTGSGEIVTTSTYPGNWFDLKPSSDFIPEIKGTLSDNFTIEFDVIPQMLETNVGRFDFDLYTAVNPKDFNEGGAIPGISGIKMTFDQNSASYSSYADGGYALSGEYNKELLYGNKKIRFSFWIQKQRLRVYANDTKIFDLPKVLSETDKINVLRFITSEANVLITDFRVAVGLPDMRSKLMTEGKIVSYGIYFDSGKDAVKPESYGSLKDIAAVLKENPTVKIKIVGHTDSDGDDAKNLELSKKRAISVKNALVADFGIEASRIETDGKGETVSIAPNTTSEGKAKNRRVEFIKL